MSFISLAATLMRLHPLAPTYLPNLVTRDEIDRSSIKTTITDFAQTESSLLGFVLLAKAKCIELRDVGDLTVGCLPLFFLLFTTVSSLNKTLLILCRFRLVG